MQGKKTWYRLIKTGLSRGKEEKNIYEVPNDEVEYSQVMFGARSLKNKKITQKKYVWIYNTSFCFRVNLMNIGWK